MLQVIAAVLVIWHSASADSSVLKLDVAPVEGSVLVSDTLELRYQAGRAGECSPVQQAACFPSQDRATETVSRDSDRFVWCRGCCCIWDFSRCHQHSKQYWQAACQDVSQAPGQATDACSWLFGGLAVCR